MKTRFLWIALSITGTCSTRQSYCQDTLRKIVPDGTQGEFQPSIDSLAEPKRKKTWNEFYFRYTTLRIGVGMLYEFAAYAQDDNSKKQMDSLGTPLDPLFKVRDFRILVSGNIKSKRTITWKAGLLYDGPSRSWLMRESGVMVDVPELKGNIFVGRTKEGFSLNKVMNGYAGWTMERQMALDVIPILADGIKWVGYAPKSHLIWNVGAYTDWLSKGQSFSTYAWQVAARVAWVSDHTLTDKKLLHLGGSIRYGKPVDGKMRLRSRPEANPAPYFIDTQTFPSDESIHIGYEAYYTSGPLMLGSEYYFHKFNSSENTNPLFKGGDFVISYMLTGESRPYTTVSGIYSFVAPSKPLLKGGPGAIEVLLRYSQLDLDDGPIQGGKFSRITPMVNWYVGKNLRLEFAYGYGVLDRFNVKGATQFFQTRLQLVIL